MTVERHTGRLVLDDYWHRSRQPLAALVFVSPILVLYECGILWLGPGGMRNGADLWLRALLDLCGFGQYFLLPLMTFGILLAWHHVARHHWRLSMATVCGMWVESTLLGFLLLAIAQLEGWLFLKGASGLGIEAPLPVHWGQDVARLVGFFGAGIYEELLFRLILLPAIAGLLLWLGEPPRLSWLVAILATSVLFSAAHFHGFTPGGDSFNWFSFLFRVVAGVFFCMLFLWRGFGIAVGAHTLYDLLVGIHLGID